MTASSRIFVVANGSSLNTMNLDPMAHDVSYATNRIPQIYPTTAWRPSRIFWGDCFNVRNYGDIQEHLRQGYECYFTQRVADQLTGVLRVAPSPRLDREWMVPEHIDLPSQVHIYAICSEHRKSNSPEAWHAHDDAYCKYGGTFQVALMHAVEEGYSPIYIIGADLGLASYEQDTVSVDYFSPEYQIYAVSSDAAASANRRWSYMHELARAYCDERDIQIYNAGFGGHLEAYERVDFDSLFE